jgi:MFS family permease
MWNISRHAYMTTGIPTWQRGKATATFGGLNRVGSFAGPYVGGLAAAAFGMRFPFVIFAVVALLALIVSGIFIRDAAPPEKIHRGGLRGHGRHLAGVLREHWHTFATAGVGQLLGQMIRSGRSILIPLYGADVIGLDIASISLIVTLSALIDMTMFLPVGYVMDRFGRKFANVPCFFVMGVGMAMIPFMSTFNGLLAAALVIGFGNGLGSGAMLTLGSDLAPKESVGEFLGMWRLIGDSGQTGAPIVVGGVAQVMGLSPATFVIATMGVAAALVFGLLVPETKDLHRAPAQAKA